MGVLSKFNEFYYPEDKNMKMDKPSGGHQISKEEMSKLEELRDGKITEVQVGEFTVSRPSELDGGYLVANQEGKHQQIRADKGDYKSELDAELKVLDILRGKVILESRRHRRPR